MKRASWRRSITPCRRTKPTTSSFSATACRTGVDPIAFERLSGLRAYNLGIVGDLGPGVMLNIGKAYLSKIPRRG